MGRASWCEEEKEEEDVSDLDDEGLDASERHQPRVPGAERGKELVALGVPAAWWVALG